MQDTTIAVLKVLVVLTTLTSGLSVQEPHKALRRWRRQGLYFPWYLKRCDLSYGTNVIIVGQPLRWQCDHDVDGCWVTMTCMTNANLNRSSLVCHLEGRDFKCQCEEQKRYRTAVNSFMTHDTVGKREITIILLYI